MERIEVKTKKGGGRVKIDYQRINNIFNQLLESPNKPLEDQFVEELYKMAQLYSDKFKHSKLVEFSRDDLKQYLVISCWQTYKANTYKKDKVTPYWFFYGVMYRSARFFMWREPDHQYFVDFSPGENDTILTNLEEDFFMSASDFMELYLKTTDYQDNVEYFRDTGNRLNISLYNELVKRNRVRPKIESSYVQTALWYVVVEGNNNSKHLRAKAKKLGIPQETKIFLDRYCRVLGRKFILDLKMDKDLRKLILNEN